jgi:hypothetical protein
MFQAVVDFPIVLRGYEVVNNIFLEGIQQHIAILRVSG